MLPRQLSLGRADAPSYRDRGTKMATRQRKTTWKDTVYMILELNLERNRSQPADTVMRSISLHLRTPKDHWRMLTDMHERY